MGKSLASTYLSAREIFDQADDLLKIHLSRLAWEGPEGELNDTVNTQPALFVHSIAALRVLEELHPGILPRMVAGHSMGELSALVASGSLPFAAGLNLVRKRGELMKQAGEQNPGGMAAVLGLDIPTLEQVCSNASIPGEIVQVANDNCPGQCVISGANPALDRAIALAQEAGARRVIRLAVSIAAHSPLMASAQEQFNQAVRDAPIFDPAAPVVGNVTAAPLNSAEEIRQDLVAQLLSRVRWTESVMTMRRLGVNTLIELGSGDVLSGLAKRIDPEIKRLRFGSPDDLPLE
jgi:[acyl-carrier-protein] S-malonyltransferase